MSIELRHSFDDHIENETMPNDYKHDKIYNDDNNYYEDVRADYELSADRLTIMKVSYVVFRYHRTR